jgi:phosphomannomutase
MPEISRFYGIIIAVFHDEHNPPHFHARYGEFKAAIDIRSLGLLEGYLPGRALGLVVEWAGQHQKELLQDWELAVSGQIPRQIEPLK